MGAQSYHVSVFSCEVLLQWSKEVKWRVLDFVVNGQNFLSKLLKNCMDGILRIRGIIVLMFMGHRAASSEYAHFGT